MKKPVTLKDIAERANVSDVAVGRVLLGSGRSTVRVAKKTQQRIREIAEELNYRPNIFAQQLKGKATRIIGAVIDSDAPESRFTLLSEIERQASKRNFRLMVGQTRGSWKQLKDYVRDFSMWRIQGMIWMAHDYPGNDIDEDIPKRIISELQHVVFVDRSRFPRADANYVHIDRADGIRQAVAHLIGKGKEHIGLILRENETQPIQERRDGYLKAHREHGLKIESARMYSITNGDVNVSCGDIEERRLLEAVKDLLSRTKVDAILAQNDIAAVYIIKACVRMGYRVPEDIAVIGFDNLPVSTLVAPKITTVDKICAEQARQTVSLLMHMIEHEEVPLEERQISLKPKLVVRESG